MSAEQPGQLPSYGQYDPHGYGNQPAQADRPPIPDTVNYAFYTLIAGAAVQALSVIVSLTQIDTIRTAVHNAQANQTTTLTPRAIDALVNVIVAAMVIIGVVYVTLWLWMAFKNRAGRNWARITSTVFFAVYTLFTVLGLVGRAAGIGRSNAYSVSTSATVASVIFSVVLLLIGLAAVILLWNSRSTPYFTTTRHWYGGGYVTVPGYGPPAGGPYGPAPGAPYGPQPGQPYPPEPGGPNNLYPPQ